MTTNDRPMPPLNFVRSLPDRLFGVEELSQEGTTISGSMATGRWLERADGLISAGALGVLIDNVLGYAVMAGRGAGQWSVSSEISIDLCHPMQAGSRLATRARPDYADARGGIASAEVVDEQGNLVAVGRQHGRFISTAPPDSAESNLTVRRDVASTIFDLLETEPRVTQGGTQLEVVTGPSLVNPLGNMHGGITLCLADLAASAALETGGVAFRTASIHVTYVRPIPIGTAMTFTAWVSHQGRSFAVSTVNAVNSAGKLCATATVTAAPR